MISLINRGGFCVIDINAMTGSHFSYIINDISNSEGWFVGATDTEFFSAGYHHEPQQAGTILNKIEVFKVKE